MEEEIKQISFEKGGAFTGFVDVPAPSIGDGVAYALQAAYGSDPEYVPNDMLCMLAELDKV